MDMIKKYGIYKVPEGTKLYRTAISKDYFETMFFAFSPYGTYSADSTDKNIQIWETIESFETLFMLKGKSAGGYPYSAIVDIYNYYFPENKKEETEYLALKKGDTLERATLINSLKSNDIIGWTSTLENAMEMELFLFHSIYQNSKLVKYKRTLDKSNNDEMEADSFDYCILKNLRIIKTKENNESQWPFENT